MILLPRPGGGVVMERLDITQELRDEHDLILEWIALIEELARRSTGSFAESPLERHFTVTIREHEIGRARRAAQEPRVVARRGFTYTPPQRTVSMTSVRRTWRRETSDPDT
jgi:hypothetical protein